MKRLLILLIPCLLSAQNARYTTVKLDTAKVSNNSHLTFPDSTVFAKRATLTSGAKTTDTLFTPYIFPSASDSQTTIGDTVFIKRKTTHNNELFNVASNNRARIHLETASASDLSGVSAFRSRGTIASPTDVQIADNVGQIRGFGLLGGAWREFAHYNFGVHADYGGFITWKIKHDSATVIPTDTAVLSLYPFAAKYGMWIGTKAPSDNPTREITIVGGIESKWSAVFDSTITALQGITGASLATSGNGSLTLGTGAIVSAGAITSSGLLTLGNGTVAQAHQISSSNSAGLTQYRQISAPGSGAGGINFAAQNAASSQVNYGLLGAFIQSNSTGIHSGGLYGNVMKAGTSTRAFLFDSLSNLALINTGLTMPSTTGRFQIKGTTSGPNLFEGYKSSSATLVAKIDTNGAYTGKALSTFDSVKTARLIFTPETDNRVELGRVWLDTLEKSFGGTQYKVNRWFDMSHNIHTDSLYVSGTASETNIDTVVMGAGYPSVGKIVETRMTGFYNATGGGSKTFIFRIRKSGTLIDSVTVTTPAGGSTSEPVELLHTLGFRSIGATATTISQMKVTSENGVKINRTTRYDVNTLTDNLFIISVQISDATAGNNFTRDMTRTTTIK